MHHGKYESPRPARRRRRRKSPGMLLISVVLLLCIATAGTIAYLQDATNEVENTFTPAHVGIKPSEDVDETKKSDIQFENTGDVPVYIRATLAIYWTDEFDTTDDGVDNPTKQTIAKPATAKIEGGTKLGEDWFRVGDIYRVYLDGTVTGAEVGGMYDVTTVTAYNDGTQMAYTGTDVRRGPGGMGGFKLDFDGQMSQRPGEGQPPEGIEFSEGMEPLEGMSPPDGMEFPEGMTPPDGFTPGQMPGQADETEKTGAPNSEFYMQDKVNFFSGLTPVQ